MPFLQTFLVLSVLVDGYILLLQISTEETNFLQDYVKQKDTEDIVIIIEKGLNDLLVAISTRLIQD